MRTVSVPLLACLLACGDKADTDSSPTTPQTPADEADSDSDSDSDTDADADADADADTDADTDAYAGGWPTDACADAMVGTGNEVGDIAEDWLLTDQYGEQISLHDFCDHAVLLVGSAFW